MRIVHLSIADNGGGAARSAYKIHVGLRALGFDSRMLVAQRTTEDRDVAAFRGLGWRITDRPFRAVTHAIGLQYAFLPSSFSLLSHEWVTSADVVQVYNTHGGYLSHLILAPLSRRKTVVWRLSDMWAFTGHCAFSFDCQRWRTGCGRCPSLDTYPAVSRDMTATNWRIKQSLYRRCQLHLVAPSRWLATLVEESSLVNRFPVDLIPNGVSLEVFYPRSQHDARAQLSLPASPKLILMSATEARKGGAPLARALHQLQTRAIPDVEMVLIGADSAALDVGEFPVHRLGRISDDERLALVYSACDVLAFPALADNLPNVVLESLACGTPVVGFDVGGVPEAVRHLETGYLAHSGDPNDLALGLARLLADDSLRQALGRSARAVAEREYSVDLQARRFADLYRKISGHRMANGAMRT